MPRVTLTEGHQMMSPIWKQTVSTWLSNTNKRGGCQNSIVLRPPVIHAMPLGKGINLKARHILQHEDHSGGYQEPIKVAPGGSQSYHLSTSAFLQEELIANLTQEVNFEEEIQSPSIDITIEYTLRQMSFTFYYFCEENKTFRPLKFVLAWFDCSKSRRENEETTKKEISKIKICDEMKYFYCYFFRVFFIFIKLL